MRLVSCTAAVRAIVLGSLAGAIVGAIAGVQPARACSWVFPMFEDTMSVVAARPFIPTNVMWLAPAMDPAMATSTWWIVDDETGEVMPMTVTFDDDFTRLSPSEELLPEHNYTAFLVEGNLVQRDGDGNVDLTSAFTVPLLTTVPDVSRPGRPFVEASTTPQAASLWGMDWNSCGPTRSATIVTLAVDAPIEALAYRAERRDGDDLVVVRTAQVTAGVAPFLMDQATDASGVHDYVVTAIDGAGNESDPAVVTVDLGFPGACASSSSSSLMPLALLGFTLRTRRSASRR